MNEKNVPQEETLECETCLNEIPVSEALSGEATDYVIHFCGLECYEKWNAQEKEKKEEKA